MLSAELKGKLPEGIRNLEDVLTSYVFCFLRYSSRTVFLKRFLSEFGVSVSDSELRAADFRFWPIFPDGTEPDVVLVVGDHYLLFEAKLFSGFGPGDSLRKPQVHREIEGGLTEAENEGKEFRFIAVTGDSCVPANLLRSYRRHKPLISWTNWQSISRLLIGLLEEYGSELQDREHAADLLAILDSRNLRGYRGFEVMNISPIEAWFGDVFLRPEDVGFRGDFIGFEKTLHGLCWVGSPPTERIFSRRWFLGLAGPEEPPNRIFFVGS